MWSNRQKSYSGHLTITTIISGITLPERKLAGGFLLAQSLGLLIHCHCSDDSEGKRVKLVCAFWDERYCKNRTITDVDWSPKVCLSWGVALLTYWVGFSFRNSVLRHTIRMPLLSTSPTGLSLCGTCIYSSDQNLCSILRYISHLGLAHESH